MHMQTLLTSGQDSGEQVLIRSIIDGETELFAELIRKNNAGLYKVARSYGFNHQDAQDLMQETYISAYTKLAQFEGRSSFKTWITRILIHKCLYKKTYGAYKRESSQPDIQENAQPMHSNTVSPEKDLMRKEFGRVVAYHLEHLPLIYKTVFILREVEGFSVAETAELLDISAVSVKVRLNRAKTVLQKRLEESYSTADIFEFNLVYCDSMVNKVMEQIRNIK
jgi:RNA polymerase sigma factor (sigma-70 family)